MREERRAAAIPDDEMYAYVGAFVDELVRAGIAHL